MVLKNRAFPFWGFKKGAAYGSTIYRFIKKDNLNYFADLSLNVYDYKNYSPKIHGGVLFRHKYHKKYAISSMSKIKEIRHLSNENKKELIATILKQDSL